MKIKLIVGFRRDQEHSISAEEAHKAYYLFSHPEARTVFSDGLAIKGDQIQEIVPDWQGSMGWNASHILDSDDWSEINNGGVGQKLKKLMSAAREVASFGDESDLNIPLSEVIKKYPQLGKGDERTGGMKRIGDIIN